MWNYHLCFICIHTELYSCNQPLKVRFAWHSLQLPACGSLVGVYKQEKRCHGVKFHVLKAWPVTFIDPIRSHTQWGLLSVWLHPYFSNERRVGTETAPLNSQRTPDLSRVYLTESHCSNCSWFPPRWRLLLCGGSQSRVAGSTPYLSLRPNRGGGVFMAQSGLCSQSGAAPDSLRCLLQSPLRYL